MIEFSRKMNGTPLRARPSDEGHGGSDMGLCIQMRRGIEEFWKKRGMSGLSERNPYSKYKPKTEPEES
jgi:hypothetical protein